jgi:ATP-dependent Clp protease protease subunit
MEKKIRLKFEVPACALERWDRSIMAAETPDEKTANINIYSTVGEYGDGSGMTAKIVSSILRKADGKDVVVNINSGGGDFFEGLAIHSLLSEYEGNVRVRVLGLAASAASIIALAGNETAIAKSGFIMIHNSWTVAVGNKDDMKEVAKMLAKFDDSMAALYAKKTGLDEKEVAKMMAAETWLSGEESMNMKFAHSFLGDDEIQISGDDLPKAKALRRVDLELAKAGMPRSDRRALIKELVDTPCAIEETKVTPCADETKEKLSLALVSLLRTIND